MLAFKKKSSPRPAFTLLELIVVLLVLGVLAAIAVPTFNRVKENSLKGVVDTMLEASSRAGEATCLSNMDLPLTDVVAAAADGLDGKGAIVTTGADTVTVAKSSGAMTAEGSVTFTLCGSTITPATITSAPASSTTTTVPAELDTSGDESATAPPSTGTFTDTSNGLTIERASTQMQAATSTANWEYISVTYNPGTGEVTDTVYKTSGADVVGVLTRNSNTSVTIALDSSVAFTLTIKYNGKSTGTIYIFPAI